MLRKPQAAREMNEYRRANGLGPQGPLRPVFLLPLPDVTSACARSNTPSTLRPTAWRSDSTAGVAGRSVVRAVMLSLPAESRGLHHAPTTRHAARAVPRVANQCGSTPQPPPHVASRASRRRRDLTSASSSRTRGHADSVAAGCWPEIRDNLRSRPPPTRVSSSCAASSHTAGSANPSLQALGRSSPVAVVSARTRVLPHPHTRVQGLQRAGLRRIVRGSARQRATTRPRLGP